MVSWNGRRQAASRVSWEITNGPIPEGMEVCHNCPGGDNPRCVRPDHLFLGTRAENMADRKAKGGYVSRRGEANNLARLTETQVLNVRRRYASGEKVPALADEYGVTSDCIRRIVRGQNWSHLPTVEPRIPNSGGERSSHARLTWDTVASLRADNAAGLTYGELTAKYGISESAVSMVIRGLRWKSPNVEYAPTKRKIAPDQIPLILARHAAGERSQDIARDYGVVRSAIWHIVKSYSK